MPFTKKKNLIMSTKKSSIVVEQSQLPPTAQASSKDARSLHNGRKHSLPTCPTIHILSFYNHIKCLFKRRLYSWKGPSFLEN